MNSRIPVIVISLAWCATWPTGAAPAQVTDRQSQSEQVLRDDWLFQADGSPSLDRTIAELLWTEQLAARLQKRENPPPLASELSELEAVREKIASVTTIPKEPPVGAATASAGQTETTDQALSPREPVQYTVGCWIRTRGDVMDVLGTGLTPGDFLLVVNRGPVRAHHFSDKGANALDGKIVVNDGRWHHIAQTVADGRLSLYVDGRLDVSADIAGKPTVSGRPMVLRSADASGARSRYRFRGDLEQAKLVERALSANEIRQLYEEGAEAHEADENRQTENGLDVKSVYLAIRRIKRAIFMKDPLIDFTKVLFVDVPCFDALNHESMHRVFPQAQNNEGRLMTLDGLRPGGTLGDLTAQRGMFWRSDLSYDATKVLFCMRPEGERTFHLYETSVEGGPLRQITDAEYDDLDPIYTPDGHITFLSNRGNSYARCAVAHPSYVVARCDADGKNLYLLSMGTEPEYTPAMLADGRVMYTRWEYTDKELFRIQSLWTMNPDGTEVSALWGNQSYWPDMLVEARPIPNSHRVIFSGQGHHDVVHGSIGIVDPKKGFNYPDGLTRVTAELPWAEVGNGPAETLENEEYHASGAFDGYRCPFPLSEELFLVSAKLPNASDAKRAGSREPNRGHFALYLMDVWGNRELIHRGEHDVLYAMPVRPRSVPRRVPNRVAWPGLASEGGKAAPGVLYSNDVFQGLPRVVRQTAKYVRVIHQDYTTFTFGLKCQMPDEKGVRTQKGDQHAGPPLTVTSNDGIKRILGVVPIQPDGSIAIEIPPSVSIHFQLLDDQYRAVHIMRSFTGVMPGETRGCVGCHESHSTTPVGTRWFLASNKGPVQPTPPPWGPTYHLGYRQDIQPILDRYCGKCHQGDGDGRKKLDMTFRPSLDGGSYTEPYLTLTLGPERTITRFAQTLCGGGAAGALLPMASPRPPEADRTVPPMTAMSFRSKLVANATSGEHHEVRVDCESARKLIAWVDLLCPYWNEGDIRSTPDPDPNDPFFADSPYPPRTPGVRPFADSPYPPRMRNAPIVNRAFCQDEFPTQADRLRGGGG